MQDTKFLAITKPVSATTAKAMDAALKRYLYGGSFLLASSYRWVESQDGYFVLTVAMVGDHRGRDATLAADTQADRLRSGGYSVKVFDTYAEAMTFDPDGGARR